MPKELRSPDGRRGRHLFLQLAATRKEVDISGAATSANGFEEAIGLIYSGKVGVRQILAKVASMEEAPEMIIDIREETRELYESKCDGGVELEGIAWQKAP